MRTGSLSCALLALVAVTACKSSESSNDASPPPAATPSARPVCCSWQAAELWRAHLRSRSRRRLPIGHQRDAELPRGGPRGCYAGCPAQFSCGANRPLRSAVARARLGSARPVPASRRRARRRRHDPVARDAPGRQFAGGQQYHSIALPTFTLVQPAGGVNGTRQRKALGFSGIETHMLLNSTFVMQPPPLAPPVPPPPPARRRRHRCSVAASAVAGAAVTGAPRPPPVDRHHPSRRPHRPRPRRRRRSAAPALALPAAPPVTVASTRSGGRTAATPRPAAPSGHRCPPRRPLPPCAGGATAGRTARARVPPPPPAPVVPALPLAPPRPALPVVSAARASVGGAAGCSQPIRPAASRDSRDSPQPTARTRNQRRRMRPSSSGFSGFSGSSSCWKERSRAAVFPLRARAHSV